MSPIELLEAMQGKHIAVVGDPMVDHYIFGRVERICPEAPVPVFIPEREERRQGGAANVSTQINALGCVAHSLMPGNVSVKTRYVAGHHLMLRVDRDATYTPDQHDVESTAEKIRLRRLDAVVLSDYARGWLSDSMCKRVIDTAHRCGLPIIVDPKGDDWSKYYSMIGRILICPNDEEVNADRSRFPDVLWKRGPRGMTLFEGRRDYGRIPAHETNIPATAKRLYDVTGAGDTVVAVVAAAVAAGASYLEAARLAALAAGYVVGEVGTTVCPLEKLKELVNASN